MFNHFNISLIKSLLRIVGCIVALFLGIFNCIIPSVIVLSSSLGLAEVLGILEEIFDKRKE